MVDMAETEIKAEVTAVVAADTATAQPATKTKPKRTKTNTGIISPKKITYGSVKTKSFGIFFRIPEEQESGMGRNCDFISSDYRNDMGKFPL
jgi:hypothetical protein